jgi:hypothetical protein
MVYAHVMTRSRAILTTFVLVFALIGCSLKDIERLQGRIEHDTGSKATVHVRTHNGVSTVQVHLLDPLKEPPAATKARVEALVRSELKGVSTVVVFAQL